MAALGMVALGVFVGVVITIGIRQIKDWTKLRQLLATVFSAAFAGAVFPFIEYLGGRTLGESLFFYPVGLLLGLMWGNAREALVNVQSTNGSTRLMGWLHIAGLVAITGLVLALLFSGPFRSLLPS